MIRRLIAHVQVRRAARRRRRALAGDWRAAARMLEPRGRKRLP